jgi:hypothetical protein
MNAAFDAACRRSRDSDETAGVDPAPTRSPGYHSSQIRRPRTLYERAPLKFWQGIVALLALALPASWLAH